MKTFVFTIDDNIRFLKDITYGKYSDIFDHPYLAMLKRLHTEFGLKVQLNLFFKTEGFNLTEMTDAYYDVWKKNSDWLKFSFHSDFENVRPYEFSQYSEVYEDCRKVNQEILRFASRDALAKTTTVHYCLATDEGLCALSDIGIKGLLGFFKEGTPKATSYSYGIDEKDARIIRKGKPLLKNGISFAPIDIVLNAYSKDEILNFLSDLLYRNSIWVMIHEQYFYSDYRSYQPKYEEKLRETFAFLVKHGYVSSFYEDII